MTTPGEFIVYAITGYYLTRFMVRRAASWWREGADDFNQGVKAGMEATAKASAQRLADYDIALRKANDRCRALELKLLQQGRFVRDDVQEGGEEKRVEHLKRTIRTLSEQVRQQGETIADLRSKVEKKKAKVH